MDAAALYALARERLPGLLEEVLRAPGQRVEDPAPETLTGAPAATHYRIAGTLSGDVGFFFDTDAAEPLSSRFLALTLGEGAEAPGGPELARLELTNILLGRLLGLAGENGAELRITGPGEALAGTDLADELGGERGASLSFRIDLAAGAVFLHFWARLEESAAAEDAPSVLIVDDSPVMCAFLEKIFREAGYQIAGVAIDGVDALDKFESLRPDLMTLDIIMPKLKGTDVLKRILENHPEAKVIMASSVSDARTVMQCLKIGAKRYIIKPYDREAVIGAVEKVLGLGEQE